MRLMLALFAILLLSVPARAHDCRAERMTFAKASCYEYAADVEVLAMEDAIAQATSGLQAATAEELIAFEAGLQRGQARWDEVAREVCRESAEDDPVEFETCRLAAATARRAQLEETLAELKAQLGGESAYDIPLPDAVEVLIPLEVPGGNGPDSVVRVPLFLPVTPD